MEIYTKLISKVNYKHLAIIPAVISVLMIIVVLINGVQLSFDFSGGLSGELDEQISQSQIDNYRNALISANLENLRFKSDGNVTTIQTTSPDREKIIEITEKTISNIRTKDTFILNLDYKISYDVYERLMKRFSGIINISENNKTTIIISSNKLDENYLKNTLSGYLNLDNAEYKFEKANFKIEEISSTLSANIRTQAIIAFIIAYILMSLVIFVSFRTLIPSVAIIAAATADISFAAGCMSIFGIELNSATLIALVMLIGYSVDTDILLTTRVLKRKMFVNDAINDAMKTGMTMTGAALLAVISLFAVGTFASISALANLSIVLIFGLVMDLMSTWFMNTGILKWYVEEYREKRKGKKIFKFKFSLFHE